MRPKVKVPAHVLSRIAGSETTATCLATIIYYVLHAPDIEVRMQKEIRSSFATYDAINANTAGRLSYVHAVCLEALRIYTPLPLGLPRIVPAGGDTINGEYIPEGVSCGLGLSSASADTLRLRFT